MQTSKHQVRHPAEKDHSANIGRTSDSGVPEANRTSLLTAEIAGIIAMRAMARGHSYANAAEIRFSMNAHYANLVEATQVR